MDKFIYKKDKTREISFPLGGIGSGCIGLSGTGRLIDWEIFNKPNKGSANGFSHFAIKAEAEGKVLDARVLNGDLHSPYSGDYNIRRIFAGFGFGPDRSTMAGMPHFNDVEFKGEFPIANLKFINEKFPGNVEMTAFNPFIPLNDEDSSIPGAFFEIQVENIFDKDVTYTISASLNNPFPSGATINTYEKIDATHIIKLGSDKYKEDDVEYGDICIATDGEDISYQEYWYRGRWFDNLGIYWRDFTTLGKFNNRTYNDFEDVGKQYPEGADICSIAAHITLSPGEKKKVRFTITWNFPNFINYWNPQKPKDSKECGCSSCDCDSKPNVWKNYYASMFKDSAESATYSLKNWDRLYDATLKFKDALFSSTLPEVVIDAISANISILKTPTCLRLEDGSFYGFEGCHCDKGCCEGTCTHVWNYAYALPFLFPKLERSMRDLDYIYNQREDGGMGFRLQLPVGRERSSFRPCADGQFGGVIKAYRDWKISGNTNWLKKNWNAIKKSIEFAWAKSNEDRWDFDRDGVLEGRQHHTLDMELFGPNSWLTGYYLAALKAAAEMAEYLGEEDTAKEFMSLFKRGKEWTDKNLFNGEYYQQIIELKDKSILQKYTESVSLHGDQTIDAYWNNEVEEIKYQIAEGCEIDQVSAQWHANLCGLGEIFDKQQTKLALKSIYKYNFKKNMRDFYNPCRIYCLNEEAGLVICDWPAEKYKPVVPLPYSEECMNGFEYQAAIHMIQEGLIDEGIEIIEAVRDRYDGEKRNPWNEFECGSNYARSMASYALLLTFSGFEFNMAEGLIGFDPIQIKEGEFSSFWSVDSGWGLFIKKENIVELKVLFGELDIRKLKLPFVDDNSVKSIIINQESVSFNYVDGYINLIPLKQDQILKVKEGNSLLASW